MKIQDKDTYMYDAHLGSLEGFILAKTKTKTKTKTYDAHLGSIEGFVLVAPPLDAEDTAERSVRDLVLPLVLK